MFLYDSLAITPQKLFLRIALGRFKIKLCTVLEKKFLLSEHTLKVQLPKVRTAHVSLPPFPQEFPKSGKG